VDRVAKVFLTKRSKHNNPYSMTSIILSIIAILAFVGSLSLQALLVEPHLAQFEHYALRAMPSPRDGLERSLLSPTPTFACA